MMATGMQGLLVWCKIITKPYGDDIAVKNMTTSWKNGLAFCAIIHHFRPDLIDFNKLSKENVAENNELAFTTAEDELGIPALLDVEDMVEMRVPDRLSIMTYVSQYYNYFKDKLPGEIEPRRVVSKKRPTKDPSESLPAKRGLGEHHITPVLQKTIPSGKKNICWSCGKIVYLMERLSIEGKLFHRICFKCTVCGKQLKNSTYEYDKVDARFYCTKDYKDKKENEQVNENNDPSTNSQKEMEHSDVPETKSNSLKNTLKSPFKRNEQFKRQGIHPSSPPSESDDGIVNVIKSKEESTKVKGKGKHTKSFFAGVIGKKHKDSQHEFTNPSYDKQLDLSNFMNRLDDKSNEPLLVSSTENIHPDIGATNDYEQINRLPRVIGHKTVKNENLEQSSNEKEGKDKVTKGHKKKLVLKLKRKKEKKVITEDHSKENNKNELDNKIKSDTTLSERSSLSKESEYENIGQYMKRNSIDNAEKIYDNINLCKVIQTAKSEPDLKIYDNCNLQPIARSLNDGKKDEVKKYGDETNIYATPNVGIQLANTSQSNKPNDTVIYETMGVVKKEIDDESNNVQDSSAQYVCVGKYGHVENNLNGNLPENLPGNSLGNNESNAEDSTAEYMCVGKDGHVRSNLSGNFAGDLVEDIELNSDNEINDNNECNEIIESNIHNSDFIINDSNRTDNENTFNDNFTDIKNDDLIENSEEHVDDNNPKNSIDELSTCSDCEMKGSDSEMKSSDCEMKSSDCETKADYGNLDENLKDHATDSSMIECNNEDKNDDHCTVEILEGSEVSVCETNVHNELRNKECTDDIHHVDDVLVIEESSNDKVQNSLGNANDDMDIQNENQEIPCGDIQKENQEIPFGDSQKENQEIPFRDSQKENQEIPFGDIQKENQEIPFEDIQKENQEIPFGDIQKENQEIPFGDIQKENQEIPFSSTTQSNEEGLIEMGNSNDVSKNDEVGQSYLDIRANLRKSKCLSNENIPNAERLPEENKLAEDQLSNDSPTGNIYADARSVLRKTSHDSEPSKSSKKTSLDEGEEPRSKSKSTEEILIEARLALGSTGRLENESKMDEGKCSSDNLASEVEGNKIILDYSAEDEHNEVAEEVDEIEDMDTESTSGIHVQLDQNVVDSDINFSTSKRSNGSFPIYAQSEYCPLLDADINNKPKESSFIITNDNALSDNKLELKNESEINNVVEEDESNKIENLSNSNDSVVSCEESINNQVEFKTSSLADDEIFSKEVTVNDDSNIVETNNKVEVKVNRSDAFNPFLSSDSSPEMTRKKDQTNPFLSSSDEESDQDDFVTDEFDDSNPFAEDVRLERNNIVERPKAKRSGPEIFQIGILEETNPFADDVLDPTNPFSDEFDDDNLSTEETALEITHVPQIVSSIPKTDKKLVLKTKNGVTVRKNSVENSLNANPNRKPRPKKRAAPKLPPANVSASNTPSPLRNRQSIKKRHAPQPPDVNKFNSIDRRNDAAGRHSIRKRKAPKPPGRPKDVEMKGEFDDCDLSNASNAIDSEKVTLNSNEDLSDIYDVSLDNEYDSPKKDEEGDSGVGGNLSDSHQLNLVEESTLDKDAQTSVDGVQENLGDGSQEQIDTSVSDVQSHFEYEEQLAMNSTEELPDLEASNVESSEYEAADQSFHNGIMEGIDTSTSHSQSQHTCEEQISLNSTEDLTNTQESNISIASSSTHSPDEQENIDDNIEADIDTSASHIQSHSESKDEILNSTVDFSNIGESNLSIASSESSISRCDSISKSIDSATSEEKFSSNLSMETKKLNGDIISSTKSISSNQDESISNSSRECDGEENDVNGHEAYNSSRECDGEQGDVNGHEALYENKVLNNLKVCTTNSLPHTKLINNISNSELRSSLPDIYSSNKQYSEKRKAPAKPPRQYVGFNGSDGDSCTNKQPKREEMAKELQFLEIKQRELEMEGVVMEKKLRECADGEPEEAYLLTWFELVNQKNNLLRRENELISMCQEIDFLHNQRNAEFELRQLMMKPDDEKTEYDTNREEELLAQILSFVTKRSNIIDQMDENRIREYEEDREILSMMAAQGLKSASNNEKPNDIKGKTDEGVKKKKNKEKTAVKAKKETKVKKKSKEKMESNGTTKHSGKEKNGGKELNSEKIDSKTKKKNKHEKKESKEKSKKEKVSKNSESKKK